ncbi:hypothetical protein [Weizmannia acidilactici]|uniref:hypothetical protein n=1 Tax=Weizmannia acidilactici TaxID=2607726 RepID=UPI00124F1353|nr:hypothetical protein [Weizmannia acidilactici]GER73434.1 hypothetical protein BpPP18_15010 [Weizmannia acidilactici]
MKYIDKDFYTNEYGGTPIQDDKFEQIANAAERAIDQATFFRLSEKDFAKFVPRIQWLVKMAISAQMEYFYELGSHTEAGMQTVQSASIGGFSFTNPQKDNKKNLLRSDVAMEYLAQTGLMYNGVDVRETSFIPFVGPFRGDYYLY